MLIFNHCAVLFFIWSASLSSGWDYDSFNFRRPDDEKTNNIAHTEFIYGKCKDDPYVPTKLYKHVHLSPEDIKMIAIAREWLEIDDVPTCVKVQGTFQESDMFRTTAYKFQMCTPVITFIYSQQRFRYFYYEWFLPDEDFSGVEWDIYFYGPTEIPWSNK